MLALASKIRTACPSGTRFGCRVCPTWSRLLGAGETAKRRTEWAVGSGVSPVSPNLKLIGGKELGDWKRHGRVLIDAMPAALRQVGPVQRWHVFVLRQQGRDTGGTGGTARHPSTRGRFKP